MDDGLFGEVFGCEPIKIGIGFLALLDEAIKLLNFFPELREYFSPLEQLILLDNTLNCDMFLILEIFMHQDYIISFMIPLLF